ncbi:1519_t:CDS:1, partial [Cetraspora pellucida]
MRISNDEKAVEIPISNTGIETLIPSYGKQEYDSDGGDTFDEFDYEEDNLKEIDGYFTDEWSEVDNQQLGQERESEENPALFLTDINKPPLNETEGKSVIDRIQEFINIDLMTLEQQRQAKEFLIKEKALFAKNVDDLGKTSVITHAINTGDATAVKQRLYRISHDENEFVESEINKLKRENLIR